MHSKSFGEPKRRAAPAARMTQTKGPALDTFAPLAPPGGVPFRAKERAVMNAPDAGTPLSIGDLARRLDDAGYLTDAPLATAIFLSLRLEQPLFLEGDAGVGKTEVAKALARVLETRLIRLQCYEGIEASQALYEWNYARQLLHVRAAEAFGRERDLGAVEAGCYSREYLIARPLLAALEHTGAPPVLLIDEIDRADDEFEALLLEMLSDFQITVPELGTIRAERPPIVVLTSNRTREVHDALKRRCLYYWIDHPSLARETEIVRRRVPGAGAALAHEVARGVERLRSLDLYKAPGVSETLDWSRALLALGAEHLTVANVDLTLGAVLKYREDQARVRERGLAAFVAGGA
jgi:MoxR-like ATPase